MIDRFRHLRRKGNMVQWRRELTRAGETIGKLEARICKNEDDLNDWIDFRKLSEGFAPYAVQMASADIWPIEIGRAHV